MKLEGQKFRKNPTKLPSLCRSVQLAAKYLVKTRIFLQVFFFFLKTQSLAKESNLRACALPWFPHHYPPLWWLCVVQTWERGERSRRAEPANAALLWTKTRSCADSLLKLQRMSQRASPLTGPLVVWSPVRFHLVSLARGAGGLGQKRRRSAATGSRLCVSVRPLGHLEARWYHFLLPQMKRNDGRGVSDRPNEEVWSCSRTLISGAAAPCLHSELFFLNHHYSHVGLGRRVHAVGGHGNISICYFFSFSLSLHLSRKPRKRSDDGNGFIICFALSQSLAKHEEADAALSKHGNKCSYETRCRTAATRISSAVKVRKRWLCTI